MHRPGYVPSRIRMGGQQMAIRLDKLFMCCAILVVSGCSQQTASPHRDEGNRSSVDSFLHQTRLGGSQYCSLNLCEAGEGDCDSDSECSSGLECARDNGPRFGFSSTTDVCVADHCTNGIQDAEEMGVDCGPECGACDRPESLVSGSPNYCSMLFPCAMGEGDCDSDVQCMNGLQCGDNNGPTFGLPRGYDACEPAGFVLPVGHANYCSQPGIDCQAGQGDCDTDRECGAGLGCATDNGPRFGFSPTTDVCVVGHCENGIQDDGEMGVDCGGECGSCFRPESIPEGSPDFCSVVFPCNLGEGDCDSDAQCNASLVCGDNNGPEYGLPPGYDACEPQQVQHATFLVTFEAMWTASSHPTNYPSNPHFSPLIGATHNGEVQLWMSGHIATPGIEVMAETGSSGILRDEIDALKAAGDAFTTVSGSGIPSGTGSSSDIFITSSEFPLLSVTSMIAPSPDWFVGVNSVSLLKSDGTWIDQMEIDLFAYDAGSDSGTTFTSPNSDTMPKEEIGRLMGGDFDVKFGTLTITRQ